MIIKHGENDLSLYGYNQSVSVREGQLVKAWAKIAEVGSSGGQSRSGLYFEIRRKGGGNEPDGVVTMSSGLTQSAANICLICTALFQYYKAVAQPAKLAIVIDDIGYRPKEDAAIYALPREVSVAIIPSAPYAKQRNEQARKTRS